MGSTATPLPFAAGDNAAAAAELLPQEDGAHDIYDLTSDPSLAGGASAAGGIDPQLSTQPADFQVVDLESNDEIAALLAGKAHQLQSPNQRPRKRLSLDAICCGARLSRRL